MLDAGELFLASSIQHLASSTEEELIWHGQPALAL